MLALAVEWATFAQSLPTYCLFLSCQLKRKFQDSIGHHLARIPAAATNSARIGASGRLTTADPANTAGGTPVDAAVPPPLESSTGALGAGSEPGSGRGVPGGVGP